MDKKKLLLICLLTGVVGGHYFAIGRYKKGFLYLFTVGIFGLGWLYDIIRIIFSDDFVKLIEQEEQIKEQIKQMKEQIKAEQKERINKYKKEGIPYCPKCHSTHLKAQRKGFGVTKAAIGLCLTAPYGLLAGFIGSRKIELICLNCGYRFKPGRR